MKKLLIIFSAVFCFATVIFFGCSKINEFDTPATSNFAAEAKAWYYTSFVNSSEYKQATSNGQIKVPNWNYGNVYKIGNMDVAEFPLSANKKKVYITEKLSSADARRVVDATNFKVLFVKVPNKTIEIRIIEFIPTFEYLRSKSFNINHLSFKDYQKEFKGDFRMFNYKDELLKGYRFTGGRTKIIKLREKDQAQKGLKARSKNGSDIESLDPSFCDNLPQTNPNCTYEVTVAYHIVCTGGWNISEGFNADYCSIEVELIYCEELVCDDPDAPQDFMLTCLQNGGTEEQCVCQVYGIGCDTGGGNGGDECSNVVCDNALIQSHTNDFNATIQPAPEVERIVNSPVGQVGDENCWDEDWKVATSGAGSPSYWEIVSHYEFCFTKSPLVHYPQSNSYGHEYSFTKLLHTNGSYIGTNHLITTTYTTVSKNNYTYLNGTPNAYGLCKQTGDINFKMSLSQIIQCPSCWINLDETKRVKGSVRINTY
jgi:hypothetical protein